MVIHEYTAVFSHRYSAYAFSLIGLALVAGLVYLFNFTSFLGGGIQ